jgi:D-lactate dehydrogenase (cytochrome)
VQYASKEDVRKAIKELRDAFPDPNSVVTDRDVLGAHGTSPHSYHPESPHAAVVRFSRSRWGSLNLMLFGFKVRPKTTEDVVKLVNIARKYRLPVVPYSGATSLEGHFSGVKGCLLYACGSAVSRHASSLLEVSASTCQAWTRSSALMVWLCVHRLVDCTE